MERIDALRELGESIMMMRHGEVSIHMILVGAENELCINFIPKSGEVGKRFLIKTSTITMEKYHIPT